MNIWSYESDSASTYYSLSYILQVSAARIVDIDFSKPKRLSTNEVCTAHDVEAVTGVKQP